MTNECHIGHPADVITVQITARRCAVSLGFGRRESEEIAIVATELATNILKHGIRGSIRFEIVTDPLRGAGLEVIARDYGPPFRNFEEAARDGCDDDGPIDPARVPRRGGSGIGLGAVQRFSDAVRCEPRPNGKEVLAVRFRRDRGSRRG